MLRFLSWFVVGSSVLVQAQTLYKVVAPGPTPTPTFSGIVESELQDTSVSVGGVGADGMTTYVEINVVSAIVDSKIGSAAQATPTSIVRTNTFVEGVSGWRFGPSTGQDIRGSWHIRRWRGRCLRGGRSRSDNHLHCHNLGHGCAVVHSQRCCGCPDLIPGITVWTFSLNDSEQCAWTRSAFAVLDFGFGRHHSFVVTVIVTRQMVKIWREPMEILKPRLAHEVGAWWRPERGHVMP
ncbi:hypothetical protein B0H14DRAFT_3863756 [Mycena olivaceomarginata]|nr:hypothetical protein B0H14DRAFT_3863756 [Mycena olivaceomarginata]